MSKSPMEVLKPYCKNKEIAHAILNRLSKLLNTNKPAEMLETMVKRRLKLFPMLDYTVVEDQVVQGLISRTHDKNLNLLWLLYNVSYFQQDTEKFMDMYPSARPETLREDVERAFNDFVISKVVA